MTNLKASNNIDQSHGAFIEKMFWIACCFDSSDFKSFLEDLDGDAWQKMFPDIDFSLIEEAIQDGSISYLFTQSDKLGFIAEVRCPSHSNFVFEKGEYRGSSIHMGIQTVYYAYGETTDRLLKEVVRIAEENFQANMKKEKNKKSKTKP